MPNMTDQQSWHAEAMRLISSYTDECVKQLYLHREGDSAAANKVAEEISRLWAALSAHLASAPVAAPGADAKALTDVRAERQRQISAEGWTPEHDDDHSNGAMAIAAACYALADHAKPLAVQTVNLEKLWEWTGWDNWFKPKDKRHNLIRAAALLVAEIERLDRAAMAKEQE